MTTGFVLTVIQPPEGVAKYGKATVFQPCPERKNLHTLAYRALRERNPHMDLGTASRYAEQIVRKPFGQEVVEASTGLLFRIDRAEEAPHPCPCEDGCGRLVLPTDHLYADAEDAYCPGCFTWDRNVPACLPENSAHIQGAGRNAEVRE
ncbi:hypothetical protein ACFW2V_13545 [Streptomyces sp. NPDC058947]|uniref:hypothetical protein n=1 Tax=Streptomyces sp. NPDC058947 TaxID=3346675 RepID=UPI0036808135